MRYFILHLVKWDMKYRFRRSRLGILWTILQPLFLTFIISGVFGVVFNIPMLSYAPYILSGFLVWDILLASVIINSFAFIKAESYIKQMAAPIVIYSIRESLVCICTFLVALISLVVWIGIINPENLLVSLIALPLSVTLLFMLSLPVSIISAHVHVRYRDYPYVMNLVMQLFWYLSPVFFQESMFKTNPILHNIFLYNPITSILLLIRDPFLYGKLPSLFTYFYVFAIIIILCFFAFYINKKSETNVIFYL